MAFPAFALDPSRSIFQHNCRSWSRQGGLPANGVYAIAQTKDGYIWLGTAMGLVRFDGTEFKMIDLSDLPKARSTVVRSLAVSRRGGLWFGLERGSFGYSDGKTVSLSGREEWGGVNLNVLSVIESKAGDVWIGAETLLGRLTAGDNYESMMTGASSNERFSITTVCEGTDGIIWLGTARRGLYSWKDGVITQFFDRALEELNIHSIVADRQGQIWVGTERGLICYGKNLQRKSLPFPWYETRDLLEDRAGAIWAATSGGGLVRFWGEETTAFRKTDGLADDFVTALMEDAEASLWVGTRGGLSQLSPVKIPMFGKTEGLMADVNVDVTASQRGGLWIGTGDGFTYFDGWGHSYSNDVGLANSYIKRLFEARNGDLYLINGSMDVEIFSGGKIVARHANKTWPMALVEDDRGVIVAVGGDLYRVGTNYYEPYMFTDDVKPDLSWSFNMITAKDGAVWVGCDNGVCRIKDGRFEMWTPERGLPRSKVIWVCEDDEGTIWCGTEAGVGRIKAGEAQTINREDGLFDNIIYAIVPDNHGSLWMDSSRGIFEVKRGHMNDFASGRTNRIWCVAYDGLDAVKTDEKNQQAQSGCKTLDGRIWFPTAQGILMIDPTNITANSVAPLVHIQGVVANGHDLELGHTAVVSPGRGELAIHYAGLSFVAPEKLRYRYQLKGYDPLWVEAGARRSAFYTNLKPGIYRFSVQACNGDGIWSGSADSFAIELRPHFYQTGWFMGIVGLLTVSMAAGIYAGRIKHLNARQRRLQEAHDVLEKHVTSRTVELASSNESLKNEIEERKRVEAEVERVHGQLMEASRQAGQAEVASSILHNVGNVLNSVNVSTAIIGDRLHGMRTNKLGSVVKLMDEHASDLGRYLTEDEKGRLIPKYLTDLSRHLEGEVRETLDEVGFLSEKVDHIKQVVAMQQSYARVLGVLESVPVEEMVESALKIQMAAFQRHGLTVSREYEPVAAVMVEKHKVLQILVNLLQNAKQACDESGCAQKHVRVCITRSGENGASISISDNGIGIREENLGRIFSQGFTTKRDGNGFGLHSAALAAKELGGSLSVKSDGADQGATFTLELSGQKDAQSRQTERPELSPSISPTGEPMREALSLAGKLSATP